MAWNFDWNVSFQDFADLPVDGNSSVQIDLKVIAVTRADMSMGIHGQELISVCRLFTKTGHHGPSVLLLCITSLF